MFWILKCVRILSFITLCSLLWTKCLQSSHLFAFVGPLSKWLTISVSATIESIVRNKHCLSRIHIDIFHIADQFMLTGYIVNLTCPFFNIGSLQLGITFKMFEFVSPYSLPAPVLLNPPTQCQFIPPGSLGISGITGINHIYAFTIRAVNFLTLIGDQWGVNSCIQGVLGSKLLFLRDYSG